MAFWLRSLPFSHTGRTIVSFRRKRYRINRTLRFTIRWRRKIRHLRFPKAYIKGRYRLMRRVGNMWQVKIYRRSCRVLPGKHWHYLYRGRMFRIGHLRLTARIARRTYRIRLRRRKLYARIGRRLKLVKLRFVRYIRIGRRRVPVKRRGRRYIMRIGKKWRGRLRIIKRFRE